MPSGYWCSRKDLNSQHLPPQGSASTNWATTAKWCPRSESNRQHAGFESASSANWDTGAKLERLDGTSPSFPRWQRGALILCYRRKLY